METLNRGRIRFGSGLVVGVCASNAIYAMTTGDVIIVAIMTVLVCVNVFLGLGADQ